MLAINPTNAPKISYSILRLVWKFIEVDKKTRFYGTDTQLFVSEIHIIKTIKENEGIHVTGLAEKLNITKGAVSQVLMKLERKGMIIKDVDIHNQSRLSLRLSAKGETAYIQHENYHKMFNQAVEKILEGAEQEKVAFLKNFLTSVEKMVDEIDEATMI